MKVYRIRFDSDRCQVAGGCRPFVEDFPQTDAFDRWASRWGQYEFPIQSESKKRGDFIGVLSHVYISSSEITEQFRECIRSDIETLPVRITQDEGAYFLWNIMHYVDALDDATRYDNQPPFHVFPSHFVFRATAITRPMVFKVPKHPHIPLVATGFADVDNDFYAKYHQLKCKGLTFEFLWESSGV